MDRSEFKTLAISLMETRDDLVDGLIAIRKQHGLTQGDVAKRMCVSQSQVSQFEHYDSNPTINSIIRYAIAVEAEIGVVVKSAHSNGEAAEGNVTTSQPSNSY